tara:strand:- start:316 stop:552 length:237 start_codon:yes stop_codon:yes gene_type:complete
MKTFIIEEKFVGYAEVTIEAETHEEAMALYNRGHYRDSDYIVDDITYDHEFYGIRLEDGKQLLAEEYYNLKSDTLPLE